ncbi:N-acetylmuramoyl-L-alanine amidase [Streptomyces phaeoluteigriseus]|uniref:N-acetylmuramoyl-L-alanine amidase n=1 Tax=Streptomyces phaeoluteigriseus TaxID=114686 RepID=UPI00369AE65D
MRGLLASSIGVTCAAALALPLTPPATAVTARPATTVQAAPAAARPAGSAAPLAGSTQSLPLTPLSRDRAHGGTGAEQGLPRQDVRSFSLLGVVWDDPDAELHGRVQVRTRAAGTGTWSAWQDVETHNADHGADPDTPERASGHVRGATAPLWVGESDGVEVRVSPDAEQRTEDTAGGARTVSSSLELPAGMRLELVDPGTSDPGTADSGTSDPGTADSGTSEPGTSDSGATGSGTSDSGTADSGTSDPGATDHSTVDQGGATEQPAHAPVGPPRSRAVTAQAPADVPEEAAGTTADLTEGTTAGVGATVEAAEASATNAALAPLGATEIPALDRADTERELLGLRSGELTTDQRAKPYIGPRPGIVTRRGWGADEKLREKTFVYTKKVKAAFVHHTASGNTYKCSQAPSVIRGIYRYHVRSMGWRDIGYNFLVDKCGNIYEGRAGGVAKPVLGAHTLGFNSDSMGIAVLGTFTTTKPSAAAVKGIARLTAWKLGLFGANPKGKTYLKSGGGNLYRKGKNVRLNVISGHRDGFATECPGRQLYGKLGSARTTAAGYQGR